MNLQGRDLQLNLTGEDVRALQTELAQLGFPVPDAEGKDATFGQGTRDAVLTIQQASQLPATGVVDATTAAVLSRALAAMTCTVSGTVVSPDRAGVGGLRVQIVDRNVGQDVPLAETVTNDRGEYGSTLRTTSLLRRQKLQPDVQVKVYSANRFLAASDVVYNASNLVTLNVLLPAGLPALATEYETLTGALGAHYQGALGELQETGDRQDITYLANKTGWDARAVALAALADRFSRQQPSLSGSDGKAPPTSAGTAATTNAGAKEVSQPAGGTPSIAGHLPPQEVAPIIDHLPPVNVPPAAGHPPAGGGTVTTPPPQPPTGGQQPPAPPTPPATPTIHPAFYYALFRAGLPANPDTLYRAAPETVSAIWKQAIDDGVIPASLADSIPRAQQAFQALSAAHSLTAPAVVGPSTLQAMLTVSLGDDAKKQQTFAALYAQHHDDLPGFWTAITNAFGADTAKRLQLDGQLAHLTLNNAPLMARLHNAEKEKPFTSTLDLAQRGYYNAAKWTPLLDGSVPDQIAGATPEEKRANYAEVLAAQVRLSFPTAVIAEKVRTAELPLNVKADTVQGVHAFLTQHQDRFEIGTQPIEQYLARNNLGATVPAPVTDQIKRLQRVYQVTPSDEAAGALLSSNLDSAYSITRYGEDEFVGLVKGHIDEATARLTHARAHQVHHAVLNIATSYLTAQKAYPLGRSQESRFVAPDGSHSKGEPAPSPDVVAYPTLERLFGSMDFCTCSECRSILSPAAYLVDLLLFIDHPPNDPHNPQAALLRRRPDIQHLELTCENTNTPVPYIDLVNEILEYYVAHNLTLDGYDGHDSGGAASPAELLASPQFVDQTAYETLKKELFPPPLPFHRELESLRRHFNTFGVPLPAVMEALRANEAVDRPDDKSYGWRDTLMEVLQLSRAEYRLLTDRTLTVKQLYGFPDGVLDAAALASLSIVKEFTRRVGITYEDAIALLRTRFVNPNSDLIPRLEALHVPFSTLQALKAGTLSDADFKAQLPTGLDVTEYGGDVVAWVKNDANYARIMALITIANPANSEALCSFDQLEFRRANPDNTANMLHPIDFVRFLRFIRLWKKLGWTIDQTDRAISALFPAADLPSGADDAANLQRLDDGFLALLPRLGIVVQLLSRLHLRLDRDLSSLLACWAPIGTGPTSLYRQMFLTSALTRQDTAFAEDSFGAVLQDPTQKIGMHEETLRAAFHLTADELAQILDALGFNAGTALSLDTISAIYRHGWLARTLRLSVREFLALTSVSGLDPFAPPDPPNPPVVRFLDLNDALKAAGLKPVQALYLMWNQDLSGKSAPDDKQITALARTLRGGFADVETQFAVVDDPNGDIARQRMALVYGSDTADFFFSLIANTLSVDVPYGHPQPALEPAIVTAAGGNIGYDDFRKRLSYTGVLTTTVRDALQHVAGVTADFQTAVAALYTANQAQITPFFARFPDLQALYTAYAASGDPPAVKRATLLANLLVSLKRARKLQQALAGVSSAVRADAAFAQAILTNPGPLHAVGDATPPAVADLTALEAQGLSAQFFFRDTATGSVDAHVDTVPVLDYSASGSVRLPANPTHGAPISGVWSGYVEAPESAFYDLRIETDAGATVSVTLGGMPLTLTQSGDVWTNHDPISLSSGSLYALTLTAAKLTSRLAVSWRTPSRGWQIVLAQYLYAGTLVDHLRTTYIRFLKLVSLVTGLKLTADEIAYLAVNPDLQIAGQTWPNVLAVSGEPDAPTAQALRDVLLQLLAFARIKAALSPDDERLLAVLQNPALTSPGGESVLLSLTGWENASLTALLTHFGKTQADLGHLGTFRRVFDAYDVVQTFGIGAGALLAATTNEPVVDPVQHIDTVRDLQSALRARYDQADWLNVLKPINDTLRGLQRDALVAYIQHHMPDHAETQEIDTPDKLFEYFLVDVQMDPCMETSRIRLALSSVQLFIERCLLNLEQGIAPGVIDAAQWRWMKRYRVWQANREVFLWPENWLEPELRDDQSPIFKETMSELLQSDITEDSAAIALLSYLSKLEEVAKLEPCGIHYEENGPGVADDVAHVVARTAGAKRKYFYRRSAHGAWGPWEQIKLDIEDNPVVPYVWNNRLLVFWLRLIRQTPLQPADQPTSSTASGKLPDLDLSTVKSDAKTDAAAKAKVRVYAVLCWSEYYNGKWQPAKTSDTNTPTYLGEFAANAFDRSHLQLSFIAESDGLRVSINGQGYSSFLLYNTHSAPLPQEIAPPPLGLIELFQPGRSIDDVGGELQITYNKGWLTIYGGSWSSSLLERDVLRTHTPGIPFRTVDPHHSLQNSWDAPFFFEDGRHVFYVTTTESIVPIYRFSDYGVILGPSTLAVDIPPLVLKQPLQLSQIPSKHDLAVDGAGGGIVDPAPLERFVSEDANIRTALSVNTTVQYGGSEIGPAGAMGRRAGRD